jgi:hypothetical protein
MPPFVRIHAPLEGIPLWTLDWEAAVIKVPLLFQRGRALDDGCVL